MAELLAFIAVAAVVTPGQDTALTVRNTLVGGRRAGVRTAAGVVWTHAGSDATSRAATPALAASAQAA